jgi:hypothetical protein
MKEEMRPRARTNSERTSATTDEDGAHELCIRRHLRVGWWSLLVFLILGIVLEGLHSFKVGWYLDVGNETRRLMWTLAHTHGTLLALVNIAFAATVQLAPAWKSRSRTTASRCLIAASVLIPFGFFMGGTFIYAGDPGLGILLVPPGALFLLTATLLTARSLKRATPMKNDSETCVDV